MNLSGSLPPGEANGLAEISDRLLRDPHELHVVIALVDCKSTKVDHEKGERIPTARIRQIEVIDGSKAEKKALRKMFEQARERRTGSAQLPMEIADDVDHAFGSADVIGLDDRRGGDDS